MKLVASVMVGPGEEDRYLRPFLKHLLGFCDEIRVRSETTSPMWPPGVEVLMTEPTFFNHEGQARQELLDWTMKGQPTHVLAIDSDEFVADGALLRRELELNESRTGIWKLSMTEVWGADDDGLLVRVDGKWPPRPIGIVYQPPDDLDRNRQSKRHYRMLDDIGACGRTPVLITMKGNRTVGPPVCDILHFGWACKADREARHRRYTNVNGFNHDRRHIESIMWGDDQVKTSRVPWPPSLDKKTLLARVQRT